MKTLARSALRCAALAACLATLSPITAAAEPGGAPITPARASFHDGERLVEVERIAAPAWFAGVHLTPVRLLYPGRLRGNMTEAFVDKTAIVKVDADSLPELEARGVRVVRPLMPSIGLYLVEDATGGDGIDAAQRLQPGAPSPRGIREAAPNLYLRVKLRGEFVPNDPRLSGQWFFKNLEMTKAWGLTLGDAKTNVVVVDSGCDLVHPDLKDKLDPGVDLIDGDDDPSPVLTDDGPAHGTACAGLIAASTNNGEGIAGACPECRMRCVRLINNAPLPVSASVEAFQFALDNGAAVVSNSWGYAEPTPVPKALADAINNVFDNGRGGKGALVLFAMGNDDREVGDDELEAVRGVLGIGAINNLDAATPFTNRGNCTDLVSPTGTLTTDISGAAGDDPGDYMKLFGGTSSACPVAAGIAGLLVSAAPERTSAELYDVLIKTARPAPYATPDANGHDLVFGYGIIHPVKALESVLGAGGAGGMGGAGGGGAGGMSSTSAGVGGGGGDGGDGGAAPPGGCACEVGGAPDAGGAGALVYAVGALVAAGRARRRRAR